MGIDFEIARDTDCSLAAPELKVTSAVPKPCDALPSGRASTWRGRREDIFRSTAIIVETYFILSVHTRYAVQTAIDT